MVLRNLWGTPTTGVLGTLGEVPVPLLLLTAQGLGRTGQPLARVPRGVPVAAGPVRSLSPEFLRQIPVLVPPPPVGGGQRHVRGHGGAGTLVGPGPAGQRVGGGHLSSRGWGKPGLLGEGACGTLFLSGVTGNRSGEAVAGGGRGRVRVGGEGPGRGRARRRSAGSGAACTRQGVRRGHPGPPGGRAREARSKGRSVGGAQAWDQPYSHSVHAWLLRVSTGDRFRSGPRGVESGIRGTPHRLTCAYPGEVGHTRPPSRRAPAVARPGRWRASRRT